MSRKSDTAKGFREFVSTPVDMFHLGTGAVWAPAPTDHLGPQYPRKFPPSRYDAAWVVCDGVTYYVFVDTEKHTAALIHRTSFKAA